MTGIFDNSSALNEFEGTAPVFPLPETVLFPHALLPLHIFEPRYRAMLEDALAGNRLIVLARLKTGHEELYDTKQAPIYKAACLGRVTAEQRLSDGRFYLILEGIVRVSIVSEIENDRPYRTAELKIHRDRHSFSKSFSPESQQEKLLTLCREHLGEEAARSGLMQILKSKLKLGTLCDILAYACPFKIERKQALLEERNIERRSHLLAQSFVELIQSTKRAETFPPQFSIN